MKRKLIELGGRTLVVSVPNAWARHHGLKKGDELNVLAEGKQIIFSLVQQAPELKTSLTLTQPEEFAKRRLNTAYKRGYDELDVTLEDPELIDAIKEELSTLVGFEMVKHGEKHCIIKNIASAIDEEFDTLLRRIFLMLLEMAGSSLDALQTGQFARLKKIKSAEQTNDRLTNVCKRILNKKSYKDPQKTALVYCIVWELERIADEYAALCEHAAKTKQSPSKAVTEFHQDVNAFLHAFYEQFYKFDAERGVKLTQTHSMLLLRGYTLLQKQTDDPVLVHHLISLTHRIHDIAGPYYAMVL